MPLHDLQWHIQYDMGNTKTRPFHFYDHGPEGADYINKLYLRFLSF